MSLNCRVFPQTEKNRCHLEPSKLKASQFLRICFLWKGQRDKGTVAPPASSESPVATVVGTVSFEEIKAPQDNETMTVRMGLDLLQCMGVFCGVDFGEDNGHQFFVQNSPFGVGQPKLEVLYTKSCPTCISAKKAVQSAQPAIHHNMPGPTKPKKYNVKNHSNL